MTPRLILAAVQGGGGGGGGRGAGPASRGDDAATSTDASVANQPPGEGGISRRGWWDIPGAPEKVLLPTSRPFRGRGTSPHCAGRLPVMKLWLTLAKRSTGTPGGLPVPQALGSVPFSWFHARLRWFSAWNPSPVPHTACALCSAAEAAPWEPPVRGRGQGQAEVTHSRTAVSHGPHCSSFPQQGARKACGSVPACCEVQQAQAQPRGCQQAVPGPPVVAVLHAAL